MTQGSKQIFAILLSLVLVFLPLNGAVAGLLSIDQSHDHASHSMVDMDHKVSMSDCDNHADSCSAKNTCEMSNDCSSGHCVSSLVGILGDVSALQNIPNQIEHTFLNYSVLPNVANSLYRAPRA